MFEGEYLIEECGRSTESSNRTARSSKTTSLQERYSKYGDRFEAVGIDDLINGDFTAALRGQHDVLENQVKALTGIQVLRVLFISLHPSLGRKRRLNKLST